MSRSSSGARNDPVARREKNAGTGRRGGASSEIHGPHPGWSDEYLIRECVGGNEQAWSALIDKYTIGFGGGNSKAATDLLRGCASSPETAFLSSSDEELAGAFRQIAETIAALRVEK